MKRIKSIIVYIVVITCLTWNPAFAVPIVEETCLACHSAGSDHSDRQIDSRAFEKSVHGSEVGCLECHPAAADDAHQEHTNVTPVNCRQCHESTGYHGTEQTSARCWDCHGTHDIFTSSHVHSRLHTSRLESTCGGCHPQQATGSIGASLLSFRVKGHAKGDLKNNYTTERCLDCHQGAGAHGETQPITTADCFRCHGSDVDVGIILGSIHGGIDNQPGGNDYFFADVLYWACLVCSLLVFTCGWMRLFCFWKRSSGSFRWNHLWERLWGMIHWVVAHKRFGSRKNSGLWHSLIFWGFLLPFGLIFIVQFTSLHMGWFSGVVSALLDVTGLALLVGALLASLDRYKINKTRSIGLFLLLGLISLSGFAVEGLRLAITNTSWHWQHPVGGILSMVMPASGKAVKVVWRIHFLIVITFLVLLPFTSLRHLAIAPLNIFFRKRHRPLSLDAIKVDTGVHFGLDTAQDLSRKGFLDAGTCLACGRCEEACPAFRTKKPLSPTTVMQTLSRQVTKKTGNNFPGSLLTAEELWACTTCGACIQACPVAVEPMVHVVDARRAAVLNDGKLPAETADMLRKLEIYGAPGGEGSALRRDWLVGIDPAGIAPLGEGNTLLWVGCQGAFHPRAQDTVRALISLAARAGEPLSLLGYGESCCGDPARRLGQEALFQAMAKRNIEKMQAHHIHNIITLCPHCRNVLGNEYPLWQGVFNVRTGVEWAEELVVSGRLEVRRKLGGNGVYHDPCYLARGAGLYSLPHRLGSQLWTEGLVLPSENGEKTFCCGAGGGAIWLHEIGERINRQRAEQLAQYGADTAVTACPYCLTMLEDGLSGLKPKPMPVVDLVEALEWASR